MILGLATLVSPVTATGTVTFDVCVASAGTITLQWPTFSGTISSNGLAFLQPSQAFPHLPKYTITQPIVITLRGNPVIGVLVIDPGTDSKYGGRSGVKFFFDISLTGVGISINDSVLIEGGSISWISSQA